MQRDCLTEEASWTSACCRPSSMAPLCMDVSTVRWSVIFFKLSTSPSDLHRSISFLNDLLLEIVT